MKQFGDPVLNWKPCPHPGPDVLEGRHVRVEPISAAAHADDLYRAYKGHDALWDYIPSGPFPDFAAFSQWVTGYEAATDLILRALRDTATDRVGGVAGYLRVTPEHGTIEVGSIVLSPEIARSKAWTEAMFLMMQWAFDAGYRRYEWKCDAFNLPSRRAAQRLGFSFEGVFRQAVVVKNRNRDTAWFSVIDKDWPALRTAFQRWLDPANFDAAGQQRERLSDLTRAAIHLTKDPALPHGPA